MLCTGLLLHSAVRNNTTKLLVHGGKHNVFLCGYELSNFAKKIFHEYDVFFYTSSIASSRYDFLLVGMHGACEVKRSFRGKVVYVNGEPERGRQLSRSYYLGPIQKSSTNDFQLFYASVAALEFDKSVLDSAFAARPKNSGKFFLMYISSRCVQQRELAFDSLSTLGEVHTGGACHGHVHSKHVNNRQIWKTAHQLYKQQYKFGLVMENTETKGYVSEKILTAFLAGAVPIYWGTSEIFELFNRKAFVYYDVQAPHKAIKEVEFLLNDEQAYENMLNEPILAPGAAERFFWRGTQLTDAIRNFLEIPENSDSNIVTRLYR